MKKIVGVLIALIIIGSSVAIFGFNVGNIRDTYLRPGLEKIPIINNLLPPLEDEEVIETVNQISAEELMIEELNLKIQELNAEIVRLSQFENTQLQFKQEKELFDQMIALEDPSAYANFYESVDPQLAQELYQQIIVKQNDDEEFLSYVKTFENMKAANATPILEELALTDMELLLMIMNGLTSEQRSNILTNMQPQQAATISRLLSPV